MSNASVPKSSAPDPKALALPRPGAASTQAPWPRSVGPKRSGRFLKGPIPLCWLTRAAALPGKALHVAIALWYRAGMQGTAGVSATNVLAAEFALDRHAKSRGIRALERAGLVAVTRVGGRSPVVDLLDVEAAPKP